MPRVRWGVTAEQMKKFDRSKQFAPYTGPIPPNGVYQWRVKVAKFIAGDRTQNPQLMLGLELVPRDKDEKRFKGYFIGVYRTPTENNQFTYVPFLDAIGVSEDDFADRSKASEDGNIQAIGPWRNDGKTEIYGQLVDNSYENAAGDTVVKKDIKWFGPVTGVASPDEDDDDGDYYDDDDDGYDDEEIDDDGGYGSDDDDGWSDED